VPESFTTMGRCVSIKSIGNARCRAIVLSALAVAAVEARPRSGAAPQRLAIYYGYPSLVNGANQNLARAVAVFSDYDVIVLGDGLEFDTPRPGTAGPAEHQFTVRLIRELALTPRRPAVYGYIDLGSSHRLALDEIRDRIDRWAAMGAAGIFFDEAGYDFGVTRQRQNAAVEAAHARGLSACLNAFRPADVFGATPTPLNGAGGGNPDGQPPALTAHDAVLLESFAVRNGVLERGESLAARMHAALAGRARFGTRVFAVATSEAETGEAPMLAEFGWWTASAFDVDSYGWGMPHFSAVTSRLPLMPRPGEEGALAHAGYTGALRFENDRWRRPTTIGTIVVDAGSRTGTLEKR